MTQFPVNCNRATTCHIAEIGNKQFQLQHKKLDLCFVIKTLKGLILNKQLDENKDNSCDAQLV